MCCLYFYIFYSTPMDILSLFVLYCTVLVCTLNLESTETSHPKHDEGSLDERPITPSRLAAGQGQRSRRQGQVPRDTHARKGQ